MCEALAEIMEPEIRKAKEQAKRDGWQEGREEGRAEGRAEGVALAKQVIRMDVQGYSFSEIAEKTGVTEEQIREILA